MIYYSIGDWSDAYSNALHIAGGDRWPQLWVEPAAAYQSAALAAGSAELGIAYGDHPRQCFDLFMPTGEPKGLVVFVHGGYWKSLDNSYWSHLAAGCVENGYAVAFPAYVLCPEVRVAQITAQIGAAITAAAGRVGGPVHLAGHSAGGHLVTRMASHTSPLAEEVAQRIGNVVSISGVHDLRPLMHTAMNETFGIDRAEALAESPVLLEPRAGTRLCCWVGGNERAEFRRQSALLANIWAGLGAETASHEDPNKHHFDVLDGLADPRHPLTRTLLDG